MLLDHDGIIQYVNRTTRDLSKQQVLGQSIFNYVADEDQESKLKNCFKTVTETKSTQLIENRSVHPDGHYVYWESRVSPIIEANSVNGFVLFTNNISKRKSTELEQHAVFSLSDDFLCILKYDGYFARVNPAFVSKLGYSEEEFLTRPFLDFIHPDDKKKSESAFKSITPEQSHLPPFENHYLAKDGNTITISWSGIIDSEGQRIIGIGRDITEHRALEQQLGHAQKMDAIGQLAGGVAHDFNNLLMAITANAELGMMSDNLTEINRRLKDIESAAVRAAELTNKLLTFSRNQPLVKKPLDPNQLITSFIKLLKRVIPENIEIIFNPTADIPLISGDRAQLEQVIMNLCVNARDAIASSGSIIISTESSTSTENGDRVLIRVRDTGCGIEASIQEQIFNPFFTTKEEGHGTGLGLSTVYGIVKEHAGSIKIESTNDHGTSMCLSLPVDGNTKVSTDAKNNSLPFGGNETILLAEDEELVSKATANTLEKAGYTVIKASNGIEAVNICKDNPEIDLVFMDVVMPKMGGPDAAKAIRQFREDLPILFASGYSPDSHFIAEERYPILNKPYRSDELLTNVRTILDND